MTRIRGIMVVAVLSAGFVLADDKKEAKFDASKMIGTWTITTGIKDGEKSDADRLKGITFEVTKDTMTLKSPEGKFEFKYTIDDKTSPVTINMEITAPEEFKSKTTGIVKFDGDKLMLCYANPMLGGEKPKDFDAKKDSKAFSFTMTKAEKKDK
jgi:uncharacterized protein (TIGR03067 family)